MSNLFARKNDTIKTEFLAASDCPGTTLKLQKDSKVAIMATKLYLIVRDLLSAKFKRSSFLKLAKLGCHQGNVNSFDQLIFFE